MSSTVNDERWIYTTGFLIRCVVGLSAWFLSSYTGMVLVEDAALYERVGSKIAHEWMALGTSQTLDALRDGGVQAWFMYFVIAAISFVLRGARALPVVIVLFNLATAYVPVLTYRIAGLLGIGRVGSLWAAKLVIFSPVFAFWSGALYKEGLVLLTLNLIVYHGLVLQKSFRARSLITVTLALMVLLGLRFYMAFLVAPIAVAALATGRRKSERRAKAFGVVLRKAVTVAALLGALGLIGFGSRWIGLLPEDAASALTQIQYSRDDLASAGSGYLAGTQVSSVGEAVRFLPVGALYFLAVPFPWELGSLRQNLVIPEMLFWLLQYPLIFFGFREGLKRNFSGSILIALLTLGMVGFYGLFVGNAGTAYRLRAQVWLLWAVFSGWYWDRRARAQTPRPTSAGAA